MESLAKEIRPNTISKGNRSSVMRGENRKTLFFQPKLTVGPIDDVYEREADTVADKVMRMDIDEPIQTKISPVNVQPKCAECEEEEKQQNQVIQRQENEGTDFTLPTPSFLRPSTGPDFLSMRQPFLDRHIFHLWDAGSALQVWNYNFNFFRRFGLTPDLSTTLTNLTAPRFIDSQLKVANPTWWEITDRDLNTTTYNLSVPLIDFNADFSPTAPSWLRTIFGGGRGVQRKCKVCEEEENLNVQRKDQTTSIHDALQSSGESLPDDTRSFMESRIGYDFSKVKVHKDTVAAKSAQSINALAYTSGNNIVFNDGQYAPNTDGGKKLLAHELTHVVQQQGSTVSRKPIVQRQERPDPIHDALLDQFSSERGIPRDQATQHSQEYRNWLAYISIAPRVDRSCSANRRIIIDIVNEALTWINDIYNQLNGFQADQIFDDPNRPPTPDHARIASALQQTFHTVDPMYVQVISSRFYHIGRMLREPDRVTIFCGGPGCSTSGSSFVGAYVDTPYQIHLCGSGRNIATFIHEMGHAVIPNVGVRNTVTPNTGIIDRAYDHERVFHHLTPEEALDNAETYGILAEALHNRSTGNLVTPQPDTTTNCSTPTPVLAAFARAELWTRRAWQLTGQWVRRLGGRPLTDLPQTDIQFLNANLPFIISTGALEALNISLTNVYTSSYHSSLGNTFNCLGASVSACNGGIVGIASGGTTTASTVTLGTQSPNGLIDFCPGWFTLSEADRIKTIFVLYLLGRPSGMVSGIPMTDAFQLANFAEAVINETLPQPTTRDATAHLSADRPTDPIPTP
jgi:hypothetical protein